MSCNTCQTKFTLFTKENACPSCGFSYCNKCLKYKCDIPNVGVRKVCGPCYNKLKSKRNSSSESSDVLMSEIYNEPLVPIDITKKLDSLENPAKPPIVMYKHMNHWDKFKKGLDPVDQEIVDRLKKLKDEDKNVPLPSAEEIRRRLALLKDQDPDKIQEKIDVHKVDTRTDQQKADDLIEEYLATLKLSSSGEAFDEEIRARLSSLRDESNKSNLPHSLGNKSTDIDDDERTVTKHLIAKALSEAVLEKNYGDVDEVVEPEVDMEVMQGSDDDDKPSCVMCDRTANLSRCPGCHDDLYCTGCFEENHDDIEMNKHKKIPFK